MFFGEFLDVNDISRTLLEMISLRDCKNHKGPLIFSFYNTLINDIYSKQRGYSDKRSIWMNKKYIVKNCDTMIIE